MRRRLPIRRHHSPHKCSSVERELRTQFLFTVVIGHKIPHDRMARSRPESRTLALIVARLVLQHRVSSRCHAVGGDELSFPRRKSLAESTPSVIPLGRRAARLIDPRREKPLQIRPRSVQRLLQIQFAPLVERERHHRVPLFHEYASDPTSFPVPRTHHRRFAHTNRSLGGFLRNFFRLLCRRLRRILLFLLFLRCCRWAGLGLLRLRSRRQLGTVLVLCTCLSRHPDHQNDPKDWPTSAYCPQAFHSAIQTWPLHEVLPRPPSTR